MKNSFLTLIIMSVLLLPLSGCGAPPLKIGVVPGPHAEILETVRAVAEREGLRIEPVIFNDYIQPNVALSQGQLDANSFQPGPFLENMVRDRKFSLVPVARTIYFPMGLYSQKISAVAALSPGAAVVIPDDPVNCGRALLLLEKAGVISLKPGAGVQPGIADIAENRKQARITLTGADRTAAALPAAELVAINSHYAAAAGLAPLRNALLLEDAAAPYANIIAVQAKDAASPAVAQLIAAYRSEEVRRFILERYGGAILPAW